MTAISKQHLMTTSAIAGFAMLHLAPAAHAQSAFGIRNDQTDPLEITVAQGDSVTGTDTGVFAAAGPIDLDNAGTIRGDGTNLGGLTSLPSAGVMIAVGPSSVTNSGTITGAANGITTVRFFNAQTGLLEGRAPDTVIVNSGTVSGEGDDGIRLIGGGSVENSGTITGFGNPLADGISMFPFEDQPNAGYAASANNTATGAIRGQRFGVIMSEGGEVTNAGEIAGNNGGVLIQAVRPITPSSAVSASIVNSGTINGTGNFGFTSNEGEGVSFIGTLVSASLVNSGTIGSAFNAGVNHASNAELAITNEQAGRIEGATSGIIVNAGSIDLTNAGIIRGNGVNIGGFNTLPGAGVVIRQPDSTVTNSGTISGAQFGIVSLSAASEVTGEIFNLAARNTIVNSGTILGEGNDGVRLVGGGRIENSGSITGRGSAGADGASMLSFEEPAGRDYAGSLLNAASGTITGDRFGIIFSNGAEIVNDGTITGTVGGALVQGNSLPNGALGPATSLLTVSVTNTGTISGTGDFGFGALEGFGLTIGGDLASATVVNSGEITSAFSVGFQQASTAAVALTNAAGGRIEGATSGIYSGSAGALTIDNAGTIRGNGSYEGFDAPPDAGITIASPGSSVTNTGTISGAGAGVTTAFAFDSQTGNLLGLAVGTQVVNSGTIAGEGNDGVRLIGGGSVENSGTISGTGSALSDGISMFPFTEQASADYAASVDNAAAGTITGQRFGIILSAGGDVTNAGGITGGSGGVFIQGTALNVAPGEDRSGLTASIANTGTIRGTGNFGLGGSDGYGAGFGGDLSTATLVNSGTITSAFHAGASHRSLADLTVTNLAGGRIEGATSGIYSGSAGTLAVVNAGLIRGNGSYEGLDAPPDAGITIATGGSSVSNSGTISGAGAGITTAFLFDSNTRSLVGVAVGTSIVNSGTIAGEGNDGIRLIGGGSVSNSGTITGTGGPLSDGISMFPFTDQANADYAASIDNAATGSISGQRFGIILSAGGEVTNAGTVTGGTGGMLLQGTATNVAPGEDRSGLTASLTNTGTVSGTGNFGFAALDGYGMGFAGDLSTATLINAGTITSAFNVGVSQGSLADLTVTNQATGRIEGATSGIFADSDGTLSVVNAGIIRGNGSYEGLDAPPDAGITIATAGSSISNSGTISGAGAGITTAFSFDSLTSSLVGLAVGTSIVNSGTIAGESNDGVRLIGGGSVENSGTISGTGSPLSDGVSMFPFTDQANADYSASVDNAAAGTISGERFGVILSAGGSASNAGDIAGGAGGVFIQGTALNVAPGEDRSGLTASLVNSGTISGTGNFGAAIDDGFGVGFAGDLATVTLTNSGTITSAFHAGVSQGSAAVLSVTNAAAGRIEGATSGIVVLSGTLELTNAGTIRGEGSPAGLGTGPNGGVMLLSGDNVIANSGTISGAQNGIVTGPIIDPVTQAQIWEVGRTTLTNTGTIAGGTSDAILLLGGGAVVNSGTVTSGTNAAADGIQLQFYPGQDSGLAQIGSIANTAGGTITAQRYGIILAGGGTIANAGSISGGTNGIALVTQGFPGKTGAIDNSGTITGGILIDLAEGEVRNSGTITNAAGPGVQIDGGRTQFVNSGRISGVDTAIRFAGADDVLILETGSIIEGAVDGGEGLDALILDGDVLVLTPTQQLGETNGFESLTVAAGYWTTAGLVGAFDTLTINAGATLRISEITPAGETAGSPLSVPAVITDGALVLDFADSAALDAIADTPVTGAGSLQLVGEGVLTVAGSNLAHTGGTTVSNGGLILTGTLPGDVVTQGDGVFQLGIGGTEGAFAGNLVNNGRFVFNRSDDYDFAGDFSGTGVLDKLGAGVLIFSGAYDFSGVTNILAGSVRLAGVIDPETEFNLDSGGTLDVSGSDQTIAGLAGAPQAQVELGGQTLTINQNTSTTFAGTITGTGGIAKTGDGRLELTGNSTFTGPTTVNGGILAVNGSIISPVTVNPGGTLAGNGSVGNTTVSNGGVVAPGNSIGRLTVNGDLVFAAGAIYEVEADAAGRADRIDATGRVTIAGTAQLAVLAEAGTYRPRTDYTVLTAAGGVTGRFGSVTSDLAFLTPFVRYGAGAVTLSLYRNDIAFAAAAGNANQAGVAGAVQSLGIDNPLFEAVLVQNAAGAQAIFADLSGELHASAVTGLADDSRHLRNALLGMPAATAPGLFVWGSGFGGWGEFDRSAANFGMDTNHNGLVTGVGLGGEGFAVAVSAGIGGSEFTLGGRGDNADVASRFVALHGTFGSEGGLRGSAGLSYAWHDLDTARSAAAPIAQTLAGETDAHTFQIFGEIGYQLVAGKAAIMPFARVAHVSTDADSFTETGGAAALAVDVAGQDTTFLSFGAKVQMAGEGARFQPYAALAWNRALGDRRAVASARFAGGGTAFGVAGVAIPEDSAEIDAGFEYRTGRLGIGAGYTGVIASGRDAHGGRITARWQF